MDSNIYNSILKNYQIKRDKKILEAQNRKIELYNRYPAIRELEDEKNKIAISTTKKIISLDSIEKQIEQDNMNIKLQKIDDKIDREFKTNNLSKDILEPNFDCKNCNDTGFIINNGKSEYCPCFKQQIINEVYKQANMNKIEDENFNTFDIGYYSNTVDKSRYGISKSPRQNIECIKKIAQDFSNNILNIEQKNLLFTGNTGLGKTFLANAIAKSVIENTNTVIYQTAPIFMDKLMEYKFSSDNTGMNREQYDKIFSVDLLIIDDLGTETMTNNKFTELFNIINTRLLNNKKILISTNLTLKQLYDRYDERVMSRIIGEFIICKFVGDDIRLKKKKMVK